MEEKEVEEVVEKERQEVVPHNETKPYAIIGDKTFNSKEEYTSYLNKKRIEDKETKSVNEDLKKELEEIKKDIKMSKVDLSKIDPNFKDFVKSQLDINKTPEEINNQIEEMIKANPKLKKENTYPAPNSNEYDKEALKKQLEDKNPNEKKVDVFSVMGWKKVNKGE